MAQHDYVIDNQSGASFRADLNVALSAIVSNNSGATEPSTTYAYQTWADTTAGVMKLRNAANSAWITLYELDGTYSIEAGTAAAPGLYFRGDTDTGIYSPGANSFAIATNGLQRINVDSNGYVNIGAASVGVGTAGVALTTVGSTFVRSSGVPVIIERLADDGNLIAFYQAGTLEGAISVSGTTVTYGGGHLARWSQFPNSATRKEILRGTVLSNIDEMCIWSEEKNEQLNRMKVSDIEGDPNVSGVFQSWDDDDDTYTNDFYCAMTGDFIIRIAAGTPVHKGQLLMSAGNGTAKPQDDDIVRSKTIAKVTSNHITLTYEDGSYCVPCVLMAC